MTENYTALCPGCFEEKGAVAVCPHCGYDEAVDRGMLALPYRRVLHDEYVVGRVLGKPGGFGVIYLGWDVHLQTRVAIKEFLPRDLAGRQNDATTVAPHSQEDAEVFRHGLEQFVQEARTLARLDHPNIVRVRTFFEANGTAYLVMDYYQGMNLEEYLQQQGGRLAEEQAVSLMMPVLDGLREVHAAGFLHRDIKPQNIYLRQGAAGVQPILLDFGAARVAMGERSRSLSVVLTEGFAPPEQYSRRGEQGPWTDVYACATTLYYLVTGTVPPPAMDRMMADDLEIPEGVSPHLREAMLSALSVNASARPQTVEAFQEMLVQGTPTPPVPPTPVPPPPQPARGAGMELTLTLTAEEARQGGEKPLWNGTRSVPVPFPAGVEPGTELRVPGAGKQGADGGEPGDLVATVELKAAPRPKAKKGGMWIPVGLVLAAAVAWVAWPKNQPPEAAGDDAQTRMDIPVTIQVVANDRDPDGDALRVAEVAAPQNGKADIDGGYVTYTPEAGFAGTDRFIYTATDGRGGTAAATVTVRVSPHVFKGHTGNIWSVDITPDGRYALSASVDSTLKLWDLETGKEIRTFRGHTNAVTGVDLSPDGRSALSTGWDNTLRLWDVESGRQLRSFSEFTGNTSAVQFSPDGRHALSAGKDYGLGLWDVETGKKIRTLGTKVTKGKTGGLFSEFLEKGTLLPSERHTGWVFSVAFSPDGRYALSASADSTLKLWDVETGREIRAFRNHTGDVFSVDFSPDGRYALSASADRTLRLWDVETGEQTRVLRGHTDRVMYAQFSPDGRYILSASSDWRMCLWEAETGRRVRTFQGHQGQANTAKFSPDGRRFLSASMDSTLRLWEVDRLGQEIRILRGHTNRVVHGEFSPDGRYALSASFDSTMRLWEVETGREIRTFAGSDHSWVLDPDFSPDGRYVLSLSVDNTTPRLWEVSTGRQVNTLEKHDDRLRVGYFSPDSRYVMSVVSGDSVLRLWEVETGRRVRTFAGHVGQVNIAKFSPDSRYVISAGADHTLRSWRVETGERIRTFEGHADTIWWMDISPDGRYVMSAGNDRQIYLWEADSGRRVRTFTGHTGIPTYVKFSPDGRYALSVARGGEMSSMYLWEVETGRRIHTFEKHAAGYQDAQFSLDSRYVLLVRGLEETPHLWETRTGRLVRTYQGHDGWVMNVDFSPDSLHFMSAGADETLRLWKLPQR